MEKKLLTNSMYMIFCKSHGNRQISGFQELGLEKRRLKTKLQRGNFLGSGDNRMYLNCSGYYMTVYICQDWLSHSSKFYCKFYLKNLN